MIERIKEILAPAAEHIDAELLKPLLEVAEAELHLRPLIHMAWKDKRWTGPELDDAGNAVVGPDGQPRRVDRTYTVTYELGKKNPADETAEVFAIFPHESANGIVVYSYRQFEIDEKQALEYWCDFVYQPDGWRGVMSPNAIANYTLFLLADDDEEPTPEPEKTPARVNGHA
jgi:hypothetical protein